MPDCRRQIVGPFTNGSHRNKAPNNAPQFRYEDTPDANSGRIYDDVLVALDQLLCWSAADF
jgi:hypothetical protein